MILLELMQTRWMFIHSLCIHPKTDLVDVLSKNLLFLLFVGEVAAKDASTGVVGVVHAGRVVKLALTRTRTYRVHPVAADVLQIVQVQVITILLVRHIGTFLAMTSREESPILSYLTM